MPCRFAHGEGFALVELPQEVQTVCIRECLEREFEGVVGRHGMMGERKYTIQLNSIVPSRECQMMYNQHAMLTPCQQKALDILMREGNVFLTGAAGTGKSFLLEHYLKGKPADGFPIVASTGAAAVIVGGRTFHSFFGLGILEGGPEVTITKALHNRRLIRRLNRAHCVIIDEVSMLSGLLLQTAERICRHARDHDEPWGGLRIIAVGDFAQLPPIAERNAEKDWAFRHPVWEMSNFQPALLSTVMRTQDLGFLKILNLVREGIVNDTVCDFLDARTEESTEETEGPRLYPRREQADHYNMERLNRIDRPVHAFRTEYAGKETDIEKAKKNFPILETLLLKEGALVMMRKNDVSGDMRYVNGSLGIVERIGGETLIIRLLTDEKITAVPEKFSSLDGDGKELVSAWNFPVTLAWATTIHKSQGASLDRLILNMEHLWEPGQAYVALSRVRSGRGLSIACWDSSSIRAEPLVTAFYNSLTESAKKYVPRPFFTVPEQEKRNACHAESLDATRDKRSRSTVSKERRRSPAKIIPVMIQEKGTLEQMAETCGIETDTVLRWIEKLVTLNAALDLEYLLSDIPEAENIRSAFAQLGMERLKPVYDYFEGAIPYSTLKLVRGVVMAESKDLSVPQ